MLIAFRAYSQDTIRVEAHRVSDEEIIRIKEEWDFSQEKNWKYFQLRKTLTVTIIQHWPAITNCGVVAVASETIVQTKKRKLIRVLDLCNTQEYKIGQIIKIIPVEYSLIDKKNLGTGAVPDYSPYDTIVLKTTWGSISVIE